jgi:hypothetical protein
VVSTTRPEDPWLHKRTEQAQASLSCGRPAFVHRGMHQAIKTDETLLPSFLSHERAVAALSLHISRVNDTMHDHFNCRQFAAVFDCSWWCVTFLHPSRLVERRIGKVHPRPSFANSTISFPTPYLVLRLRLCLRFDRSLSVHLAAVHPFLCKLAVAGLTETWTRTPKPDPTSLTRSRGPLELLAWPRTFSSTIPILSLWIRLTRG